MKGFSVQVPSAPDAPPVQVRADGFSHPVLGPCHSVWWQQRRLTCFSAVNLDAVDFLPAMDDPAALPSGSGSGILNVLAQRSVGELRYRGPYPTGALFDALCESFAPVRGVTAAWQSFAPYQGRIGGGEFVEIDEPFVADCFERISVAEGCVVQQRRGTAERAWFGGVGFRAGVGTLQLRASGADAWTGHQVFGGRPYRQVVAVSAGTCQWSVPSETPAGPPLKRAVSDAIVKAICRELPGEVHEAFGATYRGVAFCFAELGLDACRLLDGNVVMHQGLLHLFGQEPRALIEQAARVSRDVLLRDLVATG